MTPPSDTSRLSRRQVIKMFTAVSASLGLSGIPSISRAATMGIPQTFATGYGTDPVLTKVYKPGDVWPLTLKPEQRRAVTALCDLILPADDLGPAASAVGVPEFLDEWLSAPYPQQQGDSPVLREGIDWLDAEATKRFQKSFANLETVEQTKLCDDICNPATAKPEFKKAAEFFLKFRGLCAAGYYSTQEGWKAIGFVGNLPSPSFEGPPPEVLRQLEVEQTVR